MYLPQIISTIDNSQHRGEQGVFDYARTLQITLTAETSTFIFLAIQSIKKIADPNKYGDQIVNDVRHLLSQKPIRSILDLSQIIKRIDANYNQAFHLQLSLLSIHSNPLRLIAAAHSSSQLLLYRNNQIIKLPLSQQGITGPLEHTDLIILPSKEFLDHIHPNKILLSFRSPQLGLRNLIDTRYPALMLGFKKQEPLIQPTASKPTTPQLHSPQFKPSLGHLQPSTINKSILIGKKRRAALGIALIFVILLTITLFIGHQKRQQLEQQRLKQQLTEEVSYRIQQAESLKNLNTLRAKTLLQEAKSILTAYQQNNNNYDLDVQALAEQVTQAYATVAKQYLISAPEVFFDLSLVKEGFKVTQASTSEDILTLLDDTTRTLIQINLTKKSADIIAGADVVPNNAKLGSIPAWAFLTSGGKLQIIDRQSKQQLKSFTLSTIQVDQLIGYGNNAYILDKNIGQLWRFRGTIDGLNKPDRFFEEDQDLSHVALAAIDGSVWFLRLDGGIEKYTTGIKDAYYPQLDLDIPLGIPTAFATTDTSSLLYILDPDNHRLVVITKQAQYQSQYVWEGIDQTAHFTASEELDQLLIIKDDKIYAVELRD